MAFKGCTSLKNYEFERQLSVRSQQNEFIQNSLLQLYSESILFYTITIV